MAVSGDLDELREQLPPSTVVIDPDVIEGYRWDRSNSADAGNPLAVVRVSSTADVQATLRWATAHHVAVVTRGAGTGLSGGSVAVEGAITLSTERMRRIEIDAPQRLAVVQPGAFNAEVKAAAHEHGLWYPPDPSSFEICSIGGNAATNAGGLCCVKYGVTTDYVLGLEVVLADGTLLRLGGRTIKDVAGYDLKRLFIGSEGTLGVITELILRLIPTALPPTTMVATFPGPASAGHAVSTIASQMRPSVLELMDRAAIRAVDEQFHMELADCGTILIAQSDAGGERGRSEMTAMVDACRAAGSDEAYWTEDADEGTQLMTARRLAIPAAERIGTVLVEDIGVPLDRVATLLVGIERVAAESNTLIATIGHAGDGNFHPLIVFDKNDAQSTARAELAFGQIMDLALEIGGTITGEHGVGTLKMPWLERQVGAASVDLMRRIKCALDPLGILNPGKAV
jgi:glycolate oxidase